MSQVLSEEEVLMLRRAHKAIKDKKTADKIKAIMMVHSGFSYEQITIALMIDETTVGRYLKRFKVSGIEGLVECRYTGGTNQLTLIQETELKEELQVHTRQTIKDIRQFIQGTYGITYSISGTTKLLHRLGFTYKKPKVIPGKADQIKQAAFINQYHQIKDQLGTNDRIYFMDATHPQHNSLAQSGWILKGKANDKHIKSNTGRARLNLNGAYDSHGHQAIVLSEETINSESTIRLLEVIGRHQKTGKIYLILDNARYHHSRLVGNWILNHPRYKLIFLPSYSPNLNIIERLWKYYHKRVTWNRYFESFEDFKTTSLAFFKNLNDYQYDLKTLLTDNFQTLPDLNMQS